MGSNDMRGIDVAIVGGGIVGVITALGLVKRNINVRLYERAIDFHEVGAGLGFTASAEWAMKVVDPRVHAVFKSVATRNTSDWFQYVDGQYEGNDIKHLFKLYLGERGFEGCSRPDFLDELGKLLPPGTVTFGKEFDWAHPIGKGSGEKLELKFTDGTTATADLVIGCDGIHSRVRQLVLGKENPASYPHYSHKYAIRGLIPMDKANEAIGEEKTCTRYMYLGPGAHLLTFPVAQGAFLNVVGFVTDPNEWPHEKLTATTSKAEVSESFKRFGPTVRKLIELLPDELNQWAVFDTLDHPASTYVEERLALLGDAAHASSPHHGAGAGCGIEDAAVLCTLVDAATRSMQVDGQQDQTSYLRTALATYDTMRRERASWVVQSSRFTGELYEWQTHAGSDTEKCHREAYDRCHKIWDYNIDAMIRNTIDEYSCRMEQVSLKA